ncbi:hypothetical protein [Pseudolysinimonas yzui]|uniref:Sugar phosphate isomerase/epimerase n=1 Tax=Pseudolysinimonas yzui TaxID=2708254 RepID=A0A8J3GSM5_9MICO|nr:hypothetical protein [Pseudolysinimonas yzui]GHF26574.1 hypothetical protein GCM10011600_29460 [Pseudolysinimonas yzui]
MKLGFVSGCMSDVPLADVIGRAARSGFDTLEVSARLPGGPGLAHIDAAQLDAGAADRITTEFRDPVWTGSADRVKRGLEIARDTLRPLVGVRR